MVLFATFSAVPAVCDRYDVNWDGLVECVGVAEHVAQVCHPRKVGAVASLPHQVGAAREGAAHRSPFAFAPLIDAE